MSSISIYESLKQKGTWTDCLKYVLSSSDRTEIEKHLKQSSFSSYDDLQILIFLSMSTKNTKNLLEIFKKDSLPVKLRTVAGQNWLRLQKDEKQAYDFMVETITDKNTPRYLKHEILKSIHRIGYLKKSPSFFYNLTCRLTESCNHDQYNLDAHLVPFCTKDQILDLLSRWSLTRLEQIDCSSPLYSKLIRRHPLVVIHLIKGELNEKKTNHEKFANYFRENDALFRLLVKKEPKALCHLTIEYLNQLEQHRRLLPQFIQSNQSYFFKKAPDEMIELITILASNQPGQIKYETSWSSDGCELDSFTFPRSFSIDQYVRLFFALYDKCKWSSNHTITLVKYMLEDEDRYSSLNAIKKQRKWLFDIVIQERIGKELFIKKLLKDGDLAILKLLQTYSELTTPLSLHLISQYERKGIVEAKQRLSLIRYQTMTQDIYDQFLSLFKQTGSDVNRRLQNYPLFLQCAVSTSAESVKNVLQWIEKRFTNEQLMVIEHFLTHLSTYNNPFHLEILPHNFESIESIMEIAINHLQKTTKTLQIIVSYGFLLLEHVEHYSNKQQREQIQAFACKIIKRCLSMNESLTAETNPLSETYPQARSLIGDILVSDVFPKLLSKSMLADLDDCLSSWMKNAWRLPRIDSFINSFFTDHLPSSAKLQSAFQIDRHSSIIALFLKNHSTRFERLNQLINNIDKTFFIDKDVQRIAVHSQQYRQLIDKLIEDDKCLTLDKLSNDQSKLSQIFNSKTKNIKLPGLDFHVLNSCSRQLTGNQQEHITKIILNDYLQDKEVSNLDKLRSLRVLRRLTHTYNDTLQWFDKKQGSPLAAKSDTSAQRSRGADAQPLDDIIICLPATFDLTSQNLLKQFDSLKTILNASNAKFISKAMLSISHRIPDELFLKHYLEFIRNEQFQKLGITANKEILRLLTEYASDPGLTTSVVKPLWDGRPHQDVRGCIILTLLHFVGKSNSNNDQTAISNILKEAAYDDYLPVVQSLFAAYRGATRWSLSTLKNSSDNIYKTFVNEIQFRVLDHPTSLAARSWAWSHIDHEHCDTNKLIEKAQQLCIQFDKDANTVWASAFEKIMSSYKQQQISSFDVIVNIIKKIMSRREEIDSNENAIDDQHDLPVYHRIHYILTNIISEIDGFDHEKKISFRSLTSLILQFDKTLSPLMGTVLIKIAQNKEDLQEILNIFQENLSESYFERVLTHLSTILTDSNSCSFIQQLNVDEKFHMAQWFCEEKNRGLFIFDFLKDQIFNQTGVDREQCQNLLRKLRQNENFFLRQQALEYTVPWKEDGTINSDGDQLSAESDSSCLDMS